MPTIRRVEIQRFRGIESLTWDPSPGLSCLIGPGDSCKTTLLEAVDLTLGARHQVTLTDADFHRLDVDTPILLRVTVGELDDDLMDLDLYGQFLRGWDSSARAVFPEPAVGIEAVLTIELEVDRDLEPHWRLFSERAEEQGVERDLSWKDRQRLAPVRLGPFAGHHFAWGNRSVLNRLVENKADLGGALALASRQARQSFASTDPAIGTVVEEVTKLATDLGIGASAVQALLDVQGISLSGGAVALHDANAVPLRMLGLGSSRMLVAGLLRRAAQGRQILIVDEVELGLEPHRIHRLLNWLGAKEEASPLQVFLSSHSPVVVRELAAAQLVVLRRSPAGKGESHSAKYVPSMDQPAIRACAEGLLARRVLVCEGRTEMGLIRGQDQHYSKSDQPSLLASGAIVLDAGGSNGVARAKTFATLGYETGLFRDSDVPLSAGERSRLRGVGVQLFERPENQCSEQALLKSLPDAGCTDFLSLAVRLCKEDKVASDLRNVDPGLTVSSFSKITSHRRSALASAARKDDWFKRIDRGERLARDVVMPHWSEMSTGGAREVLADIRAWLIRPLE